MSGSVLEIRGLSKTFPGQHALINVDFDVAPGEVHALVGQNGSGKSTLIKILAGYHDPAPGASASVTRQRRGGELTHLRLGDARAAEEAGVRFVHQDLGLVETLGAHENLALGAGFLTNRMGTISWRQEIKRARAALADLGYHIDPRKPVKELSAAERTGIAIARALQNWDRDVELLVLDEPTASLPGPEVERLFDVIRTVKERGVAVVYVSHHLDEVFHIADRVTVLRDGRKIDTVPTSTLDHDKLVELIVGRALYAEFATDLSEGRAGGRKVVLAARGLSSSSLLHLDLDVTEGEIIGVAGITGSGREEVARVLFGALPRTGVVQIGGVHVVGDRPDLSVRAGLAMVPADRKQVGIMPEMAVRENMTLTDLQPYWIQGLLRVRKERSEVSTWLDTLDVRPRQTERLIKTLSGGNQQKVLIAKWLRVKPKVLVLDEPTQGVDVGAKADIHRLVDHAAEAGAAVIVCSTDTEELVRLCHRVVVMQRGVARAVLTGDEITVDRINQLQLQVAQEATA